MARHRRSAIALGLLICGVSPISSAFASENITYRYDERGRLIQVSRSGTVNNGVNACYAYDKADNRTNVTVATSDCSVTQPPPAFSINDVSVTEGGNLVLTVTKTGSTSSSFSVNYATANGTATAGSDYSAASGTLTFAAADTTKTIAIATIDDTVVENAETALVNLSSPTGGATISDSQGVGTINDNDAAPTCSGVSFTIASNGAVTEGASSGFTVTKTGTATGSCSVNYGSANGSATAGSDYTATSGTLTFTSAQTSQTVSVATIDDTTVESAETFSMNLSSPTAGAVLGTPNSATATINDNDSGGACSGVSYSVNDPATVIEGSPLTFTVTKAGSTSSSCSIDYATADGTAVAPGDYTAKSGTLTFTAAQTSQTVTVTTIDNARTAGTRTMYLNLTTATGGASITDSQGLGQIQHSDTIGGGCRTCLTNDPPPAATSSATEPPPDPPQ